MLIRLANLDDLDIIMQMIENGRAHIQTYHIDQWINGYPSVETISEDINLKRGYLLTDNDEILAYYVVLNHDECYDVIDGKWLDESEYVAIHRVAVRDTQSGLGTKLFTELKNRHNHIRVDTHEGNISMNKCLLKNDFKYCGVIHLKDGAPRNAYEYTK